MAGRDCLLGCSFLNVEQPGGTNAQELSMLVRRPHPATVDDRLKTTFGQHLGGSQPKSTSRALSPSEHHTSLLSHRQQRVAAIRRIGELPWRHPRRERVTLLLSHVFPDTSTNDIAVSQFEAEAFADSFVPSDGDALRNELFKQFIADVLLADPDQEAIIGDYQIPHGSLQSTIFHVLHWPSKPPKDPAPSAGIKAGPRYVQIRELQH